MFVDRNKNITKNFKYKELFCDKALNMPEDAEQFLNLFYGCVNILQPIRDKFGEITISSGRRSRRYNKKIGGSNKSQHIIGEAFDIIPMTEEAFKVFEWCVYNLEYDQIIYEERNHVSKWIHISVKRLGRNRKESLVSLEKGKYQLYRG